MSIFSSKKKTTGNYPKAEALAERIANRIIRRQANIANELNRRTQHWNKASKLTALLLFIVLFGAICLYFLIKSI